MTSHVVSTKPAAPAPAAKVKAPAAAPAKKFDHVLGHARTEAAKPAKGKQAGGGASKKAGVNAKATANAKAASTLPAKSTATSKKQTDATDPDQQEEQAAQTEDAADQPTTGKGAPTAKSNNQTQPSQDNDEDPPTVTDAKEAPQPAKNQNVVARTNPDGKNAKDSTGRHPSDQGKRGNDNSQANAQAALTQAQAAPAAQTAGKNFTGPTAPAISTLSTKPVLAASRGLAGRSDAAASVDSDSDSGSDAASATDAQPAQNSSPDPVASPDVETEDSLPVSAPVVALAADSKPNIAAVLAQGAASPAIASVKSGAAQAAATATAAPAPAASTELQFGSANHQNIASSIRSQLMPGGGTMHIRLDPPELGPMQIHVKVDNGVVSASFQTSSDQATKLLSHSLSQLKQALEGQGVIVDRLHVEQAPKSDAKSDAGTGQSNDGSNGQSAQTPERGSQQDQQRRELLQRMWRRVAGGGDPLDLVA